MENIQATLAPGSCLAALGAYSDESKVLANMVAWPLYRECPACTPPGTVTRHMLNGTSHAELTLLMDCSDAHELGPRVSGQG